MTNEEFARRVSAKAYRVNCVILNCVVRLTHRDYATLVWGMDRQLMDRVVPISSEI